MSKSPDRHTKKVNDRLDSDLKRLGRAQLKAALQKSDERATIQLNVRLRPSVKADLDRLCENYGLSAAEIISKIIGVLSDL